MGGSTPDCTAIHCMCVPTVLRAVALQAEGAIVRCPRHDPARPLTRALPAPLFFSLPRALCEDFLQNNGTPSAVAPISAAAAYDEERLAALGPPAAGSGSPDARGLPAAARSTGGASSVAGSEAGGSQAGDVGAEEEADAACWLGGSPPKASSGSQGLGTSPSKRGGIPLPRLSSGAMYGGGARALPPVRAQAALLPLAAWQQVPAGQPQALQPAAAGGQAGQQPGTPLTPASSTNTPSALGSSFQRSAAGFLRSVSVDSDNPSLGFGAREALQQLRWVVWHGSVGCWRLAE